MDVTKVKHGSGMITNNTRFERHRLKEGAAILQSANFEGHTTSKSPFKPARGPLCIAWEFSSPGQLTVGAYLSLTLTFSHPPFTLIPLTCHSFIRRHPAACQLDRPLPAGGHPATNYLPLLGDIQQLHTYPCWGTSSNYIPTLTGGHP